MDPKQWRYVVILSWLEEAIGFQEFQVHNYFLLFDGMVVVERDSACAYQSVNRALLKGGTLPFSPYYGRQWLGGIAWGRWLPGDCLCGRRGSYIQGKIHANYVRANLRYLGIVKPEMVSALTQVSPNWFYSLGGTKSRRRHSCVNFFDQLLHELNFWTNAAFHAILLCLNLNCNLIIFNFRAERFFIHRHISKLWSLLGHTHLVFVVLFFFYSFQLLYLFKVVLLLFFKYLSVWNTVWFRIGIKIIVIFFLLLLIWFFFCNLYYNYYYFFFNYHYNLYQFCFIVSYLIFFFCLFIIMTCNFPNCTITGASACFISCLVCDWRAHLENLKLETPTENLGITRHYSNRLHPKMNLKTLQSQPLKVNVRPMNNKPNLHFRRVLTIFKFGNLTFISIETYHLFKIF